MTNDKKWLIGIDLDGTTLMSYDGSIDELTGRRIDRIHPTTKEAVKQLIDLGHYVVINTGRNWFQAKPNYEELGLNSYVINSAGGHIHNPTDTSMPEFLESIPNNVIKEILSDEIVMDKVEGWTVDDVNDTYHYKIVEGNLDKVAYTSWNTKPFDGEFEFDTQCVVIYFTKTSEEIQKVVEYMREKWGDLVHTTNWGTTGGVNGGIELNPAKSNKGSALLKVAEILGVDKENTMGFGDGENDLELIRCAEHGVSMSHGVDYIKQHANHVTTKDNNEGGVGVFLKEFFNLD